jgi:hypothetical protein
MKFGTTKISHPMAVIACLVLILVAAVALAAVSEVPPHPALAADSPAANAERPSLLNLTAEQVLRLSPLHKEMRLILLSEKDQLNLLYEEFNRETDSQRALAVQRRIHLVKTQTEVALLQAQADAARAAGRLEDAELLETSIRMITDPDRKSTAVVPRINN